MIFSNLLLNHLYYDYDRISALDLSKNLLRDEGISLIAKAISQNITLASLKVANNEITFKGLSVLCDSLKNNTALVELDLSNKDALNKNRFTWQGG